MVPVILFVVLRRRQPPAIWLASMVSLAGIYLLSDGDLSKLSRGDSLVMICALFWAIHVILVAKFVGDTDHPVTMATIQFGVCSLLGLLGYLALMLANPDHGVVNEVSSQDTLIAALPEILYAGAISGAFAFTLQIVAQQYTSPSAAAILMGTESLFGRLV